MPDQSVDPRRPWLRFHDEGVAATVAVPPLTVPDFLRHAARAHPDRPANVFLGARLTFGRLQAQANRFGHGLSATGVRRGDRVAIMRPNCPQAIIAYYAALSLGAAVVMTNPLFTERDLGRQWQTPGPPWQWCWTFCGRGFKSNSAVGGWRPTRFPGP